MSDRLNDPGLNLWTSDSALTYWSKVEAGASVVKRTADAKEGEYAVSLIIDSSDNIAYITQTVALVPGRRYRLSFWYKNSAAGKVCGVLFRDTTYQKYLNESGVWNLGYYRIVPPNSTAWRRVQIDFVADRLFRNYELILAGNGAASSTVFFDLCSIEPADKCAFLMNNKADSSTLTASTEASLFPKENIRHRWYQRPWRSTTVATDQWLKNDFGASSVIQALVIRKNNFLAASNVYAQTADSDSWTTPQISVKLPFNSEIISFLFDGAVDHEELTDGSFEAWTTSTNLTYWVEYVSGTSLVAREETVVFNGTYSLSISIDAGGDDAYVYQDFALVAGRRYNLRFVYRNSTSGKTGKWALCDTGGNVSLSAGGTWGSGVNYNTLTNSNGVWTEVSVDFTAHASYTNYRLVCGVASAASSVVYYDAASVRAIEAPWQRYHRLLIQDSSNPDGFSSVGRLYLGTYFEPSRNFRVATGLPAREDPSFVQASEYGQTSAILRDHYQTIDLEFEGLGRLDYEAIMTHFAAVGVAKDFFFIRNLADPWNETFYVRYAAPPAFTKRFINYYDASIHLVEIR